ncbi:Bax inhibitor-1/YccA family protein [Nigerium massiliense]|uniref:Bax inhibitor-1/YccA family protein n=1 Tax=Nigerium massiliense TaxID=1522317 RepID=UPI00058E7CF6|nr:Bax inhibitor-1/YccA family protein [Nigerium massiliense]
MPNNPVFNKPVAFQPAQGQQGGYDPYQTQPHGGQQGYQPQGYQPQGQPERGRGLGLMTIDDVITKTAITMGVLIAAAALTFMFLPSTLLVPVTLGSALVGFVTVLFVSLRRRVNPAGVLVYSVVEGVFIGGFSAMFESLWDGIVVQAIFATFVAAAVTLAAYKFFRIRVTQRFRRIVGIATIAAAVLMLLNLGLALAGIDLGIRGAGAGATPLTILVSIVFVVLAVANLVLDFDYVEQGIRNHAPDSESWRAAFGLTVTMVWLYTEILRVLSYFRSN